MTAASDVDLQRVREQHREISLEIADLGARLARIPEGAGPTTADARAIGDHLVRLEAALVAHFQLEQHIGFVSAAVEDAPRLGRRAVSLAGEHDALRQGIVQIREHTAQPNPSWRATQEAFRKFAIDMQEHEDHENDLISEALLDDLGGGS